MISVGSAQLSEPHVVRENATPCLRVRQNPSTDSAQRDCIAPGTVITVVETAPFWRRVVLPDGSGGWAAKKFLEPTPIPTPSDPPATLPSDAFLEVHFVDVGHGDAVWIRTHDDGILGNGVFEGNNIVIDGGRRSSDTTNPFLPYLHDRAHHDATINTLIVTHPHSDHYNGAETIFRHFEVANYYDPNVPTASSEYAAFITEVEQETIEGQPSNLMFGLTEFEDLDWGGELNAEILYSFRDDGTNLGNDAGTRINNGSIVVRLEYGEHSFLFMGDAEGKHRGDAANASDVPRFVERILLDEQPPENLRSTVLKIAHHGSETSSTQDFIDAVEPEVVVVCAGRGSFGGTFLPDESTLRRYCCKDAATRIYRTDVGDAAAGFTASQAPDGDHVVVRTNGSDLEVTQFSGGQEVTINLCLPACGSN